MACSYTLRRMRKQDIDKLSTLLERCISSSCKSFYSKRELEYWVLLYSKKNFSRYTDGWKIWVICEQKKIIGCAGLNNNNAIQAMFVDPRFQGKGLGKKLLDVVEKYARSKHITKLFLDSSLNAVDFYKRNGYVVIGEETYTTDIQAGSIRGIKMFKKLL